MLEHIISAAFNSLNVEDMTGMGTGDDIRFRIPLYTVPQAARYMRVPTSTYRTWVKGYDRPVKPGGKSTGRAEAIITALPSIGHGKPSIPFIGLAESMVLTAFRQAGVSLQHIRHAIKVLSDEVGLEYALASKRLYTDGASILFDYAHGSSLGPSAAEELDGLTRVADGQRVFADVVRGYLQLITYADDGWAGSIVLPISVRPLLTIRPDRAGAQPVFVQGGAPLEPIVARWRAGDSIAELAEDFEVPPDHLEDALRGTLAAAA